ncbi:Methyltransferase domain-containing protein [Tistlia consotensis]|uniref:Methyltransferase domain-containing protein n=1 Tax=Tistlia consotensis USBA 355 TaxID=560819 RepID=A0A1Y6BH55_9PROT|nr:class I SAM-dependent methyltransferase [Tistlia consotensis]SMF09731.1 Methyltransferase domain-containing protein [Tistlia consotensis USBA 355]SNR34284.1 Methyltransferase domain-containing protein [Tistlia consotensis]
MPSGTEKPGRRTIVAKTSEEDVALAAERLHGVYGSAGQDELMARYAEWAKSYDRDVMVLGYQLPPVVAGLFARHVPLGAGPILDVGCGTGLIGLALQALGYDRVTGADLSEAMLAVAAGRGCYEATVRAELGKRLDFPDGGFFALVASGVFTQGHAPASAFAELARITASGGRVVLTDRADGDHAAAYRAAADALVAEGTWRLIDRSRPYVVFPLSEADAGVLGRVWVYERS